MFESIAITDLLDLTALGALVFVVLFVGRYFIQRMEAFSEFMQKLTTDSTAAILRITQEYADLQRQHMTAMQQLTDQIQNGQSQAQREHEALSACVKDEHSRTREQVRGLRGRLGKVANDDADN